MTTELAGRVLSGMRPTGELHIGHYHCVLTKWVQMQQLHQCYFFVADWHALTTANSIDEKLEEHTVSMVATWLAAGIDPEKSVIYVQSQLRETAELSLMLSMICPLPWVERLPTFRDVAEQTSRNEINCGFLSYPILQAADIMIHAADYVPVGEDQLPHIEFARELARRFNDIYGKDEGWEAKSTKACKKLTNSQQFDQLCQRYHQSGDVDALAEAKQTIANAKLAKEDRQRLYGRIDQGGRAILQTPAGLVGESAKIPGLDGRKMSKSYGNHIRIVEDRSEFEPRVLKMPTDPARVKRDDRGDPAKCPVWPLHQELSSAEQQQWVTTGCKSAKIGCRDCKGVLVDNLEGMISPLRSRTKDFLSEPGKITRIIEQGNEQARISATSTMADVRAAVGLPQV